MSRAAGPHPSGYGQLATIDYSNALESPKHPADPLAARAACKG